MQLLFESSEEDNAELLGLIPGRLTRLEEREGLRVPHMGWNSISNQRARCANRLARRKLVLFRTFIRRANQLNSPFHRVAME